MTIAFLVFVALSCAAIYPAYSASRRRRLESRWLIVAPVPAVVAWFAVTASGYGAQSLANSLEVFAVFALGVVLAYVKVFAIDNDYENSRLSTFVLIIVLVVLALALRATMPNLPE